MKSYEHRLVDVVNNPPSGETYDAIGREVDARIAELEASAAVMRGACERVYGTMLYSSGHVGMLLTQADMDALCAALQSNAGTALLERMAALEAVCDSWVHGGTGQEKDWGWADHKALAAYRAMKEAANGK
jgi:hypothetical protein